MGRRGARGVVWGEARARGVVVWREGGSMGRSGGKGVVWGEAGARGVVVWGEGGYYGGRGGKGLVWGDGGQGVSMGRSGGKGGGGVVWGEEGGKGGVTEACANSSLEGMDWSRVGGGGRREGWGAQRDVIQPFQLTWLGVWRWIETGY